MASYPTYLDTNKLKVSSDSFHRYIRPQLRNLYNEYFYLVRELGGKNHSAILLYQNIEGLEESWNDWIKTCSEHEDNCDFHYKKMITHQSQAEEILNKMLFSENSEAFYEKIDRIATLNFSIGNRIRAFKEEIFRFPKRLKIETSFITKKLNNMKIYSEILMTKDIDPKLKEEFDYVWVHFFKKVHNALLKEKRRDYLIARLEELNLAWNTFHMKVSKGRIQKGLLNTIKIMHSRWNSILKIILNT